MTMPKVRGNKYFCSGIIANWWIIWEYMFTADLSPLMHKFLLVHSSILHIIKIDLKQKMTEKIIPLKAHSTRK